MTEEMFDRYLALEISMVKPGLPVWILGEYGKPVGPNRFSFCSPESIERLAVRNYRLVEGIDSFGRKAFKLERTDGVEPC